MSDDDAANSEADGMCFFSQHLRIRIRTRSHALMLSCSPLSHLSHIIFSEVEHPRFSLQLLVKADIRLSPADRLTHHPRSASASLTTLPTMGVRPDGRSVATLVLRWVKERAPWSTALICSHGGRGGVSPGLVRPAAPRGRACRQGASAGQGVFPGRVGARGVRAHPAASNSKGMRVMMSAGRGGDRAGGVVAKAALLARLQALQHDVNEGGRRSGRHMATRGRTPGRATILD